MFEVRNIHLCSDVGTLQRKEPPSPTLSISARFRCINDIWGIRARDQICCSFRSTPFSLWQMYVVALKWSRYHFISEKYRIVIHISYISFKLVPLCEYALCSATVEVMKTLLEAILWRPFQLFRRIHNCQHNKNAVPSMLIAVEGTGKNQLELGVWEMLHCHIFLC